MLYFNPYAIPPILAAFLILFFGIFVLLKNKKSQLSFFWFLTCFSISIWLTADFFLYSIKNHILIEIFSKIVYMGVTAIPICNYCFCSLITGVKLSKTKIIFFIIFYLFIIFLISNTNLIIHGVHHYFWGFYPKAGKYHSIYLMSWLTLYFIGPKILYDKVIQSKNDTKLNKQISYVFWALFLGGILGTFDFIQKYGIEFYPFGYFVVPILIGFVAFAIIKHDLLNIKVVVQKSIIYSLLIACITGIYLFFIILVEHLFQGLVGYRSMILSMILAFVIAIIFNPLRNKIHEIIDRIFFGKLPHEIAEENKLLKQELERSERLKTASTLALGLAHEIRNPLTTIKTFAEYLPEKYKDDEFVKKFSKLIPSEVERINSIIKQLLDFSKPTSPLFKNTDIHILIKETLDFLNSEFLKQKITVLEDYSDQTPVLKIDPSQIKQAFLNIILNAIDSMPNGGQLFLKTRGNDNKYIEIIISDQGCGITSEDLKHIFDPFYTKRAEGTGLGLAITHQIIKNHDGKIEVTSEINKGTTFIIKLPFERLEE